jgi:hypothetical protein
VDDVGSLEDDHRCQQHGGAQREQDKEVRDRETVGERMCPLA